MPVCAAWPHVLLKNDVMVHRMLMFDRLLCKLYVLLEPVMIGKCLQEVRAALVQERERLYEGLQAIPFLEPYPSHSNFVLSLVNGMDAKSIKDRLAHDHGIMIRHYAKPELNKYIRISVGRPEHTDAVLKALRTMQ